ncbi:MAG: peptidoglycan DD-metalloendopeptidase family protein [Rhodospirillales bacterium]|jgi:murein DD-endopeptidase MepM/ murein hydrolase activator NlpD|nr:peptidoglycan DD-metalloendopeptidase family protein [Rhodospirillales bacterium]MDP6842680.1 peptidoglycan DD-metalloendopeptidase family protein [Rhodospirillales bacterium]
MKFIRTAIFAALAGLVILGAPSLAEAQDRASRSIKKNDRDGDGRISRDEWQKRPRLFQKIDTDGDGYLSIGELRARFGEGANKAGAPTPSKASKPSPKAAPAKSARLLDGQVSTDALDAETLCGIGRGRRCDIKLAIKLGMFETGLRPLFPAGAQCRDIDEQWAIDYTYKRNRENYHGGIDMPAPFGTPMIAAAAGTVVSKTGDPDSYRGIEIILRHSPEDTGIPLWIYSQYAHFDAMPKHQVGQRVGIGEVLGPTGNSGRRPSRARRRKRARRPAIHFAVWFSASPKFVVRGNKIIPVKGRWMDPNALYRKKPPFDSPAMKALPGPEKKVPISIMFEDGKVHPAGSKIVWPYTCKRK